MPELLLYLLKVNVALVLFYGAYLAALRRLTFYHLNRLFLVFGIVFSTVYPFIDLSGLFQSHEQMEAAYLVNIPAWAYAAPPASTTPEAFDFWQLPVYLFWIGVAVMLARFILQLVSLYRIHAVSEPATYKAVPFRKVQSITQAFSFWQTIYLNPAQHKPQELESILRHELIHITGWHTLDVLLTELSVVFYWFNPGAWLMKKAVKENLEFIADQQVVRAGIDRKEYQYLLLKVVGATQPQIANQFNFPSLKRRIAMMNKMPTRKASQLRLLIVLPLVTVLLFAFRGAAQPNAPAPLASEQQKDTVVYYIDGVKATKEEAELLKPEDLHSVDVVKGEQAKQVPGNTAGRNVISLTTKANKDSEQVRKFREKLPQGSNPEQPDTPPAQQGDVDEAYLFKLDEVPYYKDKSNWPADYKDFLKRNPSVKQVAWKFNNRREHNLESIVFLLESGKVETYDYNGSLRIPAAEAKYGALPQLPPPPPPVERKQQPEARLMIDQKGGIVAPLDTPIGTATRIKQVQAKRLNAGDAQADNFILFLENSQGQGMDVYVKLKGDEIESVRVLAIAK
ncbi:M56 family metallopeptidase [Pontibacter flavimaris]|uniref:Peptidase M56 domain-containing protein n=1 Tax=Pontibacter flavimaris TaxID=1797110 RepID=A0A1Q5PA61_9BACT|nr:M56 family metallopeptidase [Pontibacter flavimaris]OKL39097.1 hypothetical protein A3841_03875 [Pontibacter flavimaris]